MGFVNNAYIILIILPVYLTGAVQNGVVFTVAISLCYLLASKGAAFTSFKLSLLTLAFPQREFLFCFFLRLLFSSRIPFSSNHSARQVSRLRLITYPGSLRTLQSAFSSDASQLSFFHAFHHCQVFTSKGISRRSAFSHMTRMEN